MVAYNVPLPEPETPLSAIGPVRGCPSVHGSLLNRFPFDHEDRIIGMGMSMRVSLTTS